MIAIIVLLLVGGGVLAFTQMQKPVVAPTSQDPSVAENSQSDQKNRGTIQSLISAGKNVVCEINMPEQKSSGTTYVVGNKVRGDFTVNLDESGKPMMSHMISDGEYMYMWTDGVDQGTKFKIDAVSANPSALPSSAPKTANLNQEVDLNCSDWAVDNTKFNVPANIKFTDMSQLMNNAVKSNGSTAPKIDPSLCDELTDPTAKAACLRALGQ